MEKKILIVDDDEINVGILKELLEEQYALATASNGQQCLEKIGRFKPDLVLLDILMPGMDGYETCRRIRSPKRNNAYYSYLELAQTKLKHKI